MTEGEKRIWAAAFAKHYDISSPPSGTVNDHARWVEWEAAQTAAAIEFAGGAVERAREQLDPIMDGFGEASGTYRMLDAMLSAAPLDLAALAATIAAGTEAGVQLTPAPPDGREQWGSAEDVARRAVAIARAILAEVREP